ncbi:hypothetical protein FPOA_07165 [Fusarium poae]|uniref:Zn(2)-C6 fungal-type domain-containing protein n=1 Tax=Fusarium poae TaxID=36050 RepID=A0A1B8AKI2_FUSPO|nr:hypothetical protein FPOA_07165 [Fusarium poae]
MGVVKRVAVIGAGPAGAIAVDALSQEKTFDLIRVFERREGPGGCWIGDTTQPPTISNLAKLANRTADEQLPIPKQLPAILPNSTQPRHEESSIYPYLETNVDTSTMEYTQEPIPAIRSERSIGMHGPSTPFRHWKVMRDYVAGILERNHYEDLVSYNTTVEHAEKEGDEWKVVLRKGGKKQDYWWTETFDAVVVASGHYWVPYVPAIEGLEQFEKTRPGSVVHSKHFRGRDTFHDRRVVVVGASVSAADIAVDLTNTAKAPVHCITIGHTSNVFFGDTAFDHPNIRQHPSIAKVTGRTVHLIDGTSIPDVDHIVFGTGYSWTLPFLPSLPVRNNRVPNLYQHVVYQKDPTLLFVGAVGAGLTFKIFEWQAVYAARILAGRATVPSEEEMQKWEADRIEERGDGPKFSVVFPDFEDYFETVRELAGEGEPGVGRCTTCKAKHTKCDETRPECLRCVRKGVKCGGYWKEFKWSFKHQPGEIEVDLTTGTSPTSSRRGSEVQPETSPAATSSILMDTSDLDQYLQIEELPVEDPVSILDDNTWTTSPCSNSGIDLLTRSGSISENCDMTLSNVEMTSRALTPPFEPQYYEATPLTVGLITDTSSLLISNWFEQVCTLWSGFDSDFNLNRKLALDLCTSSQSVFSSLQSMSAGFLSTRLPHMKQSAVYFLQAATTSVLSEAQNILLNPCTGSLPAGVLFSLFCVGTTMCWVDARQLGIPFFQSATKILDRLNRRVETLCPKDLELLSFFNRSLTYCEMLLAVVNQDDSDTTTYTQSDGAMQLAERYMDDSPHPWTGISPLSSQLFAQSIRLCRSFRRNLKLPKETGRDFQRALEDIQEARRLEEEILSLEFQSSLSTTNTGDHRTPSLHLAQVAEAYKLAALLHLYQTFPDLVTSRMPGNSVYANSRHIPWEEWIIPLSLRLVNVLELIPPNSGTRVIQPLLYITASTGLRYDTTTMLDISTFPSEADFASSSFVNDPFAPPPTNVISRMSLDISNARHFIMGRLNMLESSLPPKPVIMAKELIKAIWEAYDDEPPGVASVHWVDVMEDKNLRSMFG